MRDNPYIKVHIAQSQDCCFFAFQTKKQRSRYDIKKKICKFAIEKHLLKIETKRVKTKNRKSV